MSNLKIPIHLADINNQHFKQTDGNTNDPTLSAKQIIHNTELLLIQDKYKIVRQVQVTTNYWA